VFVRKKEVVSGDQGEGRGRSEKGRGGRNKMKREKEEMTSWERGRATD
jgi:hypothetical protein